MTQECILLHPAIQQLISQLFRKTRMDVLAEAISFTKQIRDAGSDAFGPWAPLLNTFGQTVAAGIALVAIAAGKSFFAPPTPAFSNYPVRISGSIAAAGVAMLFVWSKNGGTAYNFLMVSAIAVAV